MPEQDNFITDEKARRIERGKLFYAACEGNGHVLWAGPDRSTYDAAQADATAHDKRKHSGTPTAVVIDY